MRIAMTLLVGLALLLTGCPASDGCEPTDSRCLGDRLEVCNSEENWELSIDCSLAEDMFTGEPAGDTCCWYDGDWNCSPPDLCESEGDGGAS